MFLEVKSYLFHIKWGIDIRFELIKQQNNTPQTLLFFNFTFEVHSRENWTIQ